MYFLQVCVPPSLPALPQVKAELTAKTPAANIRLPEVSKALRIRWDALPSDARSPYEKEAAKLKASVDAAKVDLRAGPNTLGWRSVLCSLQRASLQGLQADSGPRMLSDPAKVRILPSPVPFSTRSIGKSCMTS